HRSPWSDEDYPRGPLSRRIQGVPLPMGLEKQPPMEVYDGSSDPDKHLENIEAMLNYRGIQGEVKCKLFPTTLRKCAMNWYKSLPPKSINSWSDLCHQFTTHFTASRRQPKPRPQSKLPSKRRKSHFVTILSDSTLRLYKSEQMIG
ncbi:hypothetical protein A2U01_0038665, partial [Trifolium medium]|nr:hypothetical protein [Trifolium medium]